MPLIEETFERRARPIAFSSSRYCPSAHHCPDFGTRKAKRRGTAPHWFRDSLRPKEKLCRLAFSANGGHVRVLQKPSCAGGYDRDRRASIRCDSKRQWAVPDTRQTKTPRSARS